MIKMFWVALVALFSSTALADVHPMCEDYFKAIDTYVEDARERYGEEATVISEQFIQAREMVKQLPEEHQETVCQQGIETIQQARQATEL